MDGTHVFEVMTSWMRYNWNELAMTCGIMETRDAYIGSLEKSEDGGLPLRYGGEIEMFAIYRVLAIDTGSICTIQVECSGTRRPTSRLAIRAISGHVYNHVAPDDALYVLVLYHNVDDPARNHFMAFKDVQLVSTIM